MSIIIFQQNIRGKYFPKQEQELTCKMCYELIARIFDGGLAKINGKERIIEIVYKVDISSVLHYKLDK